MQTFAGKFPDKLLKALLKYESAINPHSGTTWCNQEVGRWLATYTCTHQVEVHSYHSWPTALCLEYSRETRQQERLHGRSTRHLYQEDVSRRNERHRTWQHAQFQISTRYWEHLDRWAGQGWLSFPFWVDFIVKNQRNSKIFSRFRWFLSKRYISLNKNCTFEEQ